MYIFYFSTNLIPYLIVVIHSIAFAVIQLKSRHFVANDKIPMQVKLDHVCFTSTLFWCKLNQGQLEWTQNNNSCHKAHCGVISNRRRESSMIGRAQVWTWDLQSYALPLTYTSCKLNHVMPPSPLTIWNGYRRLRLLAINSPQKHPSNSTSDCW